MSHRPVTNRWAAGYAKHTKYDCGLNLGFSPEWCIKGWNHCIKKRNSHRQYDAKEIVTFRCVAMCSQHNVLQCDNPFLHSIRTMKVGLVMSISKIAVAVKLFRTRILKSHANVAKISMQVYVELLFCCKVRRLTARGQVSHATTSLTTTAQPRRQNRFVSMAFMTRGRASRADTRKRCVALVGDNSGDCCMGEGIIYLYVL